MRFSGVVVCVIGGGVLYLYYLNSCDYGRSGKETIYFRPCGEACDYRRVCLGWCMVVSLFARCAIINVDAGISSSISSCTRRSPS